MRCPRAGRVSAALACDMLWIALSIVALAQDTQLAATGRYVELAEPPDPDQVWMGLYCDGGVCELRETPVTVAVAEDGTGIAAAGAPLVLVTGLTAGEVPTSHVGYLPLARFASTRVGDAKLVATGQSDYRMMFSAGTASQQLFSLGATDDTTPSLIWAGDLDGDDKTDLVLLTSGRTELREVRLYLSSAAVGDDLVGEAGRFRATVQPGALRTPGLQLPPEGFQVIEGTIDGEPADITTFGEGSQ